MEQVQHVLRLGDEPPSIVIGEHDVTVERDLEDAAVGFDECGVQGELILDLRRQTGGFGSVVSLDAKSDRNVVHLSGLHGSMILRPTAPPQNGTAQA